MSATTQPVFIVGTGRCGTRALYKMLLGTSGVEVHHEYLCTHVQQVAALWSMARIPFSVLEDRLCDLYWPAVQLSEAATWIDSSNKAAWLMQPLREILPATKFVVLYRDGRKVTGSFFHKLGTECYDDRSVQALLDWLNGGRVMPPPEKKYWWRVPRIGEAFHYDFASFNQFQRICYHWATCNEEIKRQLKELPADSYFEVKLEDLISDPAQVEKLARFIGIEPKPEHFEALQTPQHALFPMDFQLTPEQLQQSNEICGPMMEELGYAGRDVYTVHY